jgi:hypothetical protein
MSSKTLIVPSGGPSCQKYGPAGGLRSKAEW